MYGFNICAEWKHKWQGWIDSTVMLSVVMWRVCTEGIGRVLRLILRLYARWCASWLRVHKKKCADQPVTDWSARFGRNFGAIFGAKLKGNNSWVVRDWEYIGWCCKHHMIYIWKNWSAPLERYWFLIKYNSSSTNSWTLLQTVHGFRDIAKTQKQTLVQWKLLCNVYVYIYIHAPDMCVPSNVLFSFTEKIDLFWTCQEWVHVRNSKRIMFLLATTATLACLCQRFIQV